jgi:hypothetical protein
MRRRSQTAPPVIMPNIMRPITSRMTTPTAPVNHG